MHLFWSENWEQADQRYIGILLERLVKIFGVKNATTNSIIHASSTELTAQSFDGRTINVFTHHSSDSKMNKEFYIFPENRGQDSMASPLVNIHGEQQFSPQETLASPLSLPIILTQPIVESESPNDHKSAKRQKSQMWKDDQDLEPQEEYQDSSMTKDFDRATTAEAQQ
ncbi:MAG: hypothetical protein EZS28_017767 [Streblomastix strix]|uniref:Uncharacterized protein n=1 Tax=Streblomastix strix TaxID=222440 RepID=A0A5J4VVJ4_9EUKA|nr:MAG: hypothetical protein EZS28_017767 [Streblomastix strix]